MERSMYFLEQKDMPTRWYNIQADLPEPLPPYLHPVTKEPIGPADLTPLFPMELIMQEVSTERWIDLGVVYDREAIVGGIGKEGQNVYTGDDAAQAAWFPRQALAELSITHGTLPVIEKGFQMRDRLVAAEA